jgi:hypothetical protein
MSYPLHSQRSGSLHVAGGLFSQNGLILLSDSGYGFYGALVESVAVDGGSGFYVNGHTLGRRYGGWIEIRDSRFRDMIGVVNRAGHGVSLTAYGNEIENVQLAMLGKFASRWIVESNSFVGVNTVIEHTDTVSDSIRFINNTVVDALTLLKLTSKRLDPAPTVDLSNNLLFGIGSVATSGWTQLITGESNAIDSASLDGLFVNVTPFLTGTLLNPVMGFADPAAGDYRLTESSDLIDAGTPGLNTYAYDLAGQVRTVGGSVDVGAYELATTAPEIVSFFTSGDLKIGTAVSFMFEVTSAQGYSTTIDFGMGEVPATSGVTQIFDIPGAYSVTLEAQGTDGSIARRTLNFSIRDLTLAEKLAEARSEGYVEGYDQGAASADALLAQAVAERDVALTNQASAETARDAAVLAQGAAETDRDAALAAQASAETARDAALAAQSTAETARDTALAAQAAAELAAATSESNLGVCTSELGLGQTALDACQARIVDTRDQPTFDALGGAAAYLANPANADLLAVGVCDESAAFAHWRDGGQQAGRGFASGQANLDPDSLIDGGFTFVYPDGRMKVFLSADAAKPSGWDGPAFLLRRCDAFDLGPAYDAAAYRANNPDVASALDSGAIPSFRSVTDHYVKYGFKSGRITNSDWTQAEADAWSDEAYFAANPDVGAFLQGAQNDGWIPFGKVGFAHWVNFGRYEGRGDGQ